MNASCIILNINLLKQGHSLEFEANSNSLILTRKINERQPGNCHEDIFHVGKNKYCRFPKYVLASKKTELISKAEREKNNFECSSNDIQRETVGKVN